VYVGGTEHAVGHLLYSRMWTKVLFDLGYVGYEEPYKRLVNQGMITGVSKFAYSIVYTQNTEIKKSIDFKLIPPVYVSKELVEKINKDGQNLTVQLEKAIHKIFTDFGTDKNIVTNKYDYIKRRINVHFVDGEYL